MTLEEFNKHHIQPTPEDFSVEGRIVSGTMDCVVADTRQLWDDRFDMFQSDINKALRVVVYSKSGVFIKNRATTCTIYAQVLIGDVDITNTFNKQEFSWVRISEDAEADVQWNEEHKYLGPEITITSDDVIGSSLFECNVNTQRYE